MGILTILLQYTPDLNAVRLRRGENSYFPTPLHCAASSGWLSHAQTLVEAGALVYTGPDCSPICWAKGGSGGKEPVTLFLRERLGDQGWAMITADHERLNAFSPLGISTEPTSSELRTRPSPYVPLSRAEASTMSVGTQLMPISVRGSFSNSTVDHHPRTGVQPASSRPRIKSQGLCEMCAKINLKDLCRTHGYFHYSSTTLLKQSARFCKFCNIINQVLSEHDLLDPTNKDQTILRISNGSMRHPGLCTDPPILRTLEFRSVSGCTCRGADFRSAKNFLQCLGSCDGFKGASVLVSIFSESGMCLAL